MRKAEPPSMDNWKGPKARCFWRNGALGAWYLFIFAFMTARVNAGPRFDTSAPISYFTNVASRLLATELNVNMGWIQIYPTNQYTPAVHRLLQVTANILDAQNTNFYPSVFRPLFAKDASGDIFICGYQQVAGVSGTSDPQLAIPYDARNLQSYAGPMPMADANGPVNIFGVPWVIGAKQGLPGFNQLSLVSAVQVTRKLEVTRSTLNPANATYGTNQMYLMEITNDLGVCFWNSYNAPYPRPVTVVVNDWLFTELSDGLYTWSHHAGFGVNQVMTSWPGSQWSGAQPNATPQTNAFLAFNWPDIFQNPMAYNFETGGFDSNPQWQSSSPPLPQLPQFTLSVTNHLQAYLLDGSNVIDYVQFCSPAIAGNLNQALADPNFPGGNSVYYQWSTNAYPAAPQIPYGVIDQLWVSGHPTSAPTSGGFWGAAPTPMGSIDPTAEAAFFEGFFTPSFNYNGRTYVNTDFAMQAPYTPIRTVYSAYLLQANDPLVHYLASDLDLYGPGALKFPWGGGNYCINGLWTHSDGVSQPIPEAPVSPVAGRFQPWGRTIQMRAIGSVDANAYAPAYRDPGVWSSDYWNFPTGQDWSLSWLGQVHRGTPWQTIFLKSTNILSLQSGVISPNNTGANTWAVWAGDLLPDPATGAFLDAAQSAPVTDWQLVDLLAAMLNTNDLSTLFPVNSGDPNAWAARLNGLTELTNLAPAFSNGQWVPQFSTVIISSNSPEAAAIAAGILAVKASATNGLLSGIGDILAAPVLSLQSPYLNLSTASQMEYGVNDAAYEALSSQLLPLLRVDAIGRMIFTNGQAAVQFTGNDGHIYGVQVSPDLLNWTTLGTGSPVNGSFIFPVAAPGGAASQFYRTLLVQ